MSVSKNPDLALPVMKLFRANNDDLVTIRFERHYAIAVAVALKDAGFGARDARKGCLEEWTLMANSGPDFERIVSESGAEAGQFSRPWAGSPF